jgi:hypothetical protein
MATGGTVLDACMTGPVTGGVFGRRLVVRAVAQPFDNHRLKDHEDLALLPVRAGNELGRRKRKRERGVPAKRLVRGGVHVSVNRHHTTEVTRATSDGGRHQLPLRPMKPLWQPRDWYSGRPDTRQAVGQGLAVDHRSGSRSHRKVFQPLLVCPSATPCELAPARVGDAGAS